MNLDGCEQIIKADLIRFAINLLVRNKIQVLSVYKPLSFTESSVTAPGLKIGLVT